MYEIIHVPDDASDLPEQLGTKEKFWFLGEDGGLWLFKVGRPNTGENWAEKACCEIAGLIGLPRARYEFADWRGVKGVVSPTFVPKGGRLILGNELLARVIKDYPQGQGPVRTRQHTVAVVMAVLLANKLGLPKGWTPPSAQWKAADVFSGYLMLDALVANQDRHDENWGLILESDQTVLLAPTFDHASSLGRNERDEERLRRLATRDEGSSVERYVERATSVLYGLGASVKPLTPLGAFLEAGRISRGSAQYWLSRLANITHDQFQEVFRSIPSTEITEPAVSFALRILEINRLRLLAHRS